MSNQAFKLLLEDFETTVINQLKVFQADADAEMTEYLQVLFNDFEQERLKYWEPSLWQRRLRFRPDDLSQALLNLKAVNPPNISGLYTNYTHCLDFIGLVVQDTITFPAVVNNYWDLKALEALRSLERDMLSQIEFFLYQGINVYLDEDYTAVAKPLKAQRAQYKAGLTSQPKRIQGNEQDVDIFNYTASVIPAQVQLPDYINLLARLSRYLASRIPTP